MAGKEIMAIADKVTKHIKSLAYPQGKFQYCLEELFSRKKGY